MKQTLVPFFLALSVAGVLHADDADWSRIYLGARPSLSADGSRFAFEWNDRLWLAPSTGGVAQVIAADGASRASWPVLSPDATHVAFLSNRDGASRLYSFELASNKLIALSPHTEQTLPYTFTRDGRHVLATVLRDHAAPRHARRIALIPTSPGPESILFDATAGEPALSPDGNRILFTRNGESTIYRKPRMPRPGAAGEIWLYDLKSKSFSLVVRKDSPSHSPLWTPDGLGIYYVSGDGGTFNLRHRVLASGTERALTSFTDDGVLQPTLSADGRVLLFRRGFDFWRLDPTRPVPTRLTLHPGPGWTPPSGVRHRYYTSIRNPDGGEHVAFLDEGNEFAFAAGGGLYVMDTKQREPILVHGGSTTLACCPAFAPDASVLYYLLDHGDVSEIWTARRAAPSKPWHANTSFTRSRLLHDNVHRTALTLSPNGHRLAWLDGARRLVFADTNAQHIVRGPDAAADTDYVWSPDGKWVAASLIDNHRNNDIWIISSTAAHAPCNVSRHYQWDGEPAWSPDGHLLAWSGRRDENDKFNLFYVFLDTRNGAAPRGHIDFEGLSERVKRISTHARHPFFNADSRTLAFDDGTQTSKIKIPSDLKPVRLTSRRGIATRWGTKKDSGRLLWLVNTKPSHYEKSFDFAIYPTFNLPDYHELLFRCAWGRIHDRFYDPKFHGVDWSAMKAKYLPAFRHATSYSVLQRLMGMLLGELDASHLAFLPSTVGTKEWNPPPSRENWRPTVSHLGLRFNADGTVRDVLPNGPADLAHRGIRPGDRITEIGGVKTTGPISSEILVGPEGRSTTFTFGHPGQSATNSVRVKTISYTAARDLLADETRRQARQHVHSASSNRVGYIAVAAMKDNDFKRFQNEVFSEGYGREALIIDVRGNSGGFTADRMLSMLCAPEHSYEVPRNGAPGYLFSYTTQPVWTKPIAVLCDQDSHSNAEIFAHAIQTLKRGTVIGHATAGCVIATNSRPILDFGTFRDAEYGWHLPDGTDMEGHGVVPNIVVDLTPADEVRGVDPQLDAAVHHLLR